MTMAHVLRSRVNGNGHARFWSGGGVGDRPADHDVRPVRSKLPKSGG
jgi:hypothetical protein